LRLLVPVTLSLLLVSCVDLTSRSPSALAPARGQESFRRAGHVYCLRGWLGVWSRGLDVLAQRARSELGVDATSLSDPEWREIARDITRENEAGRWRGPLILIGHSLGGDDQIRVAELLGTAGITVDLMILIDANTPPSIPPNVKRCVNLYKSQPLRDALPVFRGVKVRAIDPARTRVENVDLRTADLGFDTSHVDHFNITDVKAIQDRALSEIAEICPPTRSR
jgi:hypothetical protein